MSLFEDNSLINEPLEFDSRNRVEYEIFSTV
jgi:hypothetical protein